MTGKVNCRLGCAGWNLPKELRTTSTISYLEQYGNIFNCVEINSSFYRHHQYKTYMRWASSVPEDFSFSLKVPKLITHTAEPTKDTLARLFDEISGLGSKLGLLRLLSEFS